LIASLRRNDTSLVEEEAHLHEHLLGGIYIIGEIVSHVMLIPINSEDHFGSMSSYDINEQWWLIQHIDIVVGSGNSKKAC
jgi:hypothetical protein